MIEFAFENRVEAYLKADRQWPRVLRIEHAKYHLARVKTDEDKQFWRAVLKRNKD